MLYCSNLMYQINGLGRTLPIFQFFLLVSFFQIRKAFKIIFGKKYLDIVGNNVRYQFLGKSIVRIFPGFRNILSFIVLDYEKPKFKELGQELRSIYEHFRLYRLPNLSFPDPFSIFRYCAEKVCL